MTVNWEAMKPPDIAVAGDAGRRHAAALIRDAVGTLAALLLSFAALDDITTGNQEALTLEYWVLLACGGWLLFVAVQLLRASRRMLGGVSLVMIAGAVWAQSGIGPGVTPVFRPDYVVTAIAFVWFVSLSVALLVSGWRAHPRRRTRMAG